MRTNEIEPSASQLLVRRFSDKIQQEDPDDPLRRGLAAKVAHDRYRESSYSTTRQTWDQRFWEADEGVQRRRPEQEALLLARSQELHAAWQKFCKALPESQRQEMSGKAPDLNYLIETVTKVSETHKQKNTTTKSGKAKAKFRSFCQHLQDHKNMLKVVPSDDKYFSLLCGTVTTVVQATVNAGRIAEEIEDTLEELGEDIAYWGEQMQELGNEKMYKYIVDLYVIMFEFLTEVFVKWSSKSTFKHVLAGLNENFIEQIFTTKRKRIQKIEKIMDRELESERHRKQTQALLNINQMAQRIFEKQELISEAQVRGLLLGASTQKMLEERSLPIQGLLTMPDCLPTPNTASSQPSLSTVTEELNEPVIERHDSPIIPDLNQLDGFAAGLSYTKIKDTLKDLSAELRQYLDAVTNMASRVSRLDINADVQRRILQFTSKLTRDTLWICGPHDVPLPSQNTVTALLLTSLVQQGGLNHITYFCGVERRSDRTLSPSSKLNSMLRLFIMQLILITPETRLLSVSNLQGHVSNIVKDDMIFDDALEFFIKLRSAMPQLLFCIVDNAQDLEDRSDSNHTSHLLDFIATLCMLDQDDASSNSAATNEFSSSNGDSREKYDASGSDDGVQSSNGTQTKICFTTNGYVNALARAVGENLLDKVEYSLQSDEQYCEDTAIFGVT